MPSYKFYYNWWKRQLAGSVHWFNPVWGWPYRSLRRGDKWVKHSGQVSDLGYHSQRRGEEEAGDIWKKKIGQVDIPIGQVDWDSYKQGYTDKPALPENKNKHPVYSLWWFPWRKCTHHGLFQATKMMSLNKQLERNVHEQAFIS